MRRKLAELELEVDRQQGWVRGGTKGQARNSLCLLLLRLHSSKRGLSRDASSHGAPFVTPLTPPAIDGFRYGSSWLYPGMGFIGSRHADGAE